MRKGRRSVIQPAKKVIDNFARLEWAKDGSGVGCADGGTKNWNDAVDWAEGLVFDGKSDWRLPNVRELYSLVNIVRYNPTIDTTIFPNTQVNFYWSSTMCPLPSDGALFVRFDHSRIANTVTSGSLYVRAVRGGE